MPNDNTSVCGCGVVLDLPKSRSGNLTTISTRDFTIFIQKGGVGKSTSGKIESRPPAKLPVSEQQQQQQQQRCSRLGGGPKSRATDFTGSTSSVLAESSRRNRSNNNNNNSNRKDKRSLGRRARSAERPDSHYTYIDEHYSGSSVVSAREQVAEALYCTIGDDDDDDDDDGDDNVNDGVVVQDKIDNVDQVNNKQQSSPITNTTTTTSTTISNANNSSQQQSSNNQTSTAHNNRMQQTVYALPSMTSPPPTYDVAIAKSWQLGLPPSYEEYLYHKHALLTRSHTPPPPWTDSSSASVSGNNSGSIGDLDLQQMSRELLASQPELREYLTRLALQGSAEEAIQQYHQLLIQQQLALRKQASRAQRTRAMPPRSQSESRAHQQRIAYEDGAFCMETTAIQSAFENGVAFCSLM